jgi:hypothetical protein
VERANAIEWLPAQLNRVSSGVVTVVFHSVVMLYLSRVDQQRVMDTILEAGTRARPDARLAWLSMEQNRQEVEVRLTLWPGGVQQRIAVSDYHGTRTVVL